MSEENDKFLGKLGKKGEFIKNTITHALTIWQNFRTACFCGGLQNDLNGLLSKYDGQEIGDECCIE